MKTDGDSFRDTAVGTLQGDGTALPLIFIKGEVGNASKSSGRRPAPGKKPRRGATKESMLNWADWFAARVKEPSILIWDRLSSHRSREVIDKLESFRTNEGEQLIHVKFLPAKAAFLISPLDMGGFAIFKTQFYQLPRRTWNMKKDSANVAWRALKRENVQNLFHHCGLTSKETPQALRARLHREVNTVVLTDYQEYLDVFDQWRAGAGDDRFPDPPNRDPLTEIWVPANSGLTGPYWSRSGRFA